MHNNGTSHRKDKLIEDQLKSGNFTGYKLEEQYLQPFLGAVFFNQSLLLAPEFSFKTVTIMGENKETPWK